MWKEDIGETLFLLSQGIGDWIGSFFGIWEQRTHECSGGAQRGEGVFLVFAQMVFIGLFQISTFGGLKASEDWIWVHGYCTGSVKNFENILTLVFFSLQRVGGYGSNNKQEESNFSMRMFSDQRSLLRIQWLQVDYQREFSLREGGVGGNSKYIGALKGIVRLAG